MTNQRLRNLTTGRLHTDMSDVQTDIEYLVGETGLFTHMLPDAFHALKPWLKEKISEPRFWDDKYDPTHEGETEISSMSKEEQAAFWKRYGNVK